MIDRGPEYKKFICNTMVGLALKSGLMTASKSKAYIVDLKGYSIGDLPMGDFRITVERI